jgi:hypothetical protein
MLSTKNIKLNPFNSEFYENLGDFLLEREKKEEALKSYCFSLCYDTKRSQDLFSKVAVLIQQLDTKIDQKNKVKDIVYFLFRSLHDNPMNGYLYYLASLFLKALNESEYDCREVSGFCVPESIIDTYYPQNSRYTWDTSAQTVYEVKDGSFFCLNHHQVLWCETHQTLIKNTSFGTPHLLVGSPWLQNKRCHIRGKVLALSVRHPVNYYHWVIDILCRACLVIEEYGELSQFDYILIDILQADFQKESLAVLGIDQSKILQSMQLPYVTADLIVSPSFFFGVDKNQRIKTIQKIRNLFISDNHCQNTKGNCRIYITRQDASQRKVLNENEVIDLLKQFDFEIHTMQGKTIRQQAELFFSASIVISPHGAALTNLIFCQPEARILEICSDTYCLDYMKSLATDVDLEFHRLIIQQEKEVAKNLLEESKIKFNLMERGRLDMVIDLVLLEETLNEIFY